MGGTRQCRFAGTNFKPDKVPENAHAVPTGGTLRSHHHDPGVRRREGSGAYYPGALSGRCVGRLVGNRSWLIDEKRKSPVDLNGIRKCVVCFENCFFMFHEYGFLDNHKP